MKKYILGLFVGLFGFGCFCSALSTDYVFVGEYGFTDVGTNTTDYVISLEPGDYKVIYPVDISRLQYRKSGTSPINFSVSGNVAYGTITFSNGRFRVSPLSYGNIKVYKLDTLYTANECQSVLGLVSSGFLNVCQSDLNTCQSDLSFSLSGFEVCQSDLTTCQSNTSGFNALLNSCSSNLNSCNTSLSSCLQNNCPEITGIVNRSELKINDIVHQSAPFINITIPQEFDWDYTVDENEFDLSISGYNVDTDYIDGIITVQNSKPDVSDFNKIITDLIPLFVPGLVIILFLLFVFNLIKKIF